MAVINGGRARIARGNTATAEMRAALDSRATDNGGEIVARVPLDVLAEWVAYERANQRAREDYRRTINLEPDYSLLDSREPRRP